MEIAKHDYLKNPVVMFFIKASLMYILWLIIYATVIVGPTGLDSKVTVFIGESTAYLMNLAGDSAKIRVSYNHLELSNQAHLLVWDAPGAWREVVSIGRACNGLSIIALFMGFIVSYKGRWTDKLWYCMFGAAVIVASNIIRVVALTYNMIYNSSTFDFNHKYTYTFLVYSVIFMLWMLWVNRLSLRGA